MKSRLRTVGTITASLVVVGTVVAIARRFRFADRFGEPAGDLPQGDRVHTISGHLTPPSQPAAVGWQAGPTAIASRTTPQSRVTGRSLAVRLPQNRARDDLS